MVNTKDSLVAVTDSNKAEAGAIVYWRLSGVVQCHELRAAWTAAGLPAELLPADPTPRAALKRACDAVAETGLLVRPLKAQDARGFVLVRETFGTDGRPVYANTAEVTLVGDEVKALHITGTDEALKTRVFQAYLAAQASQPPSEVGAWLVSLAKRCSAVSLRDSGGIYFVPRHTLATWTKYTALARSVSAHATFEIPAMTSQETVAAVLDALQREATEALEALESELDMVDLKPSALATRKAAVAALGEKLAGYETLLGVSLATLKAKGEALSVRLVEASVAQVGDALEGV